MTATTSSNVKVEAVLKNVFEQLGEGPHWEESSNTLVFVDIPAKRVYRLNATTGQHQMKQLNDQVGFIIPRRSGGYVIGYGRQFAHLDFDSGAIMPMQEVEKGTNINSRLNDGKCDSKGRIWAGTITKENPGSASLYSLEVDGSVRKQFSGVTVSNGLAWSADQSTFYYIDSPAKKVYAFDFDLQAGTIAHQRTVASFPGDTGVPDAAVPDGMTIDTDDNLYVAFHRGGCVCKIDPKTGVTLLKVDIPCPQVTSVSWGGANLDEMYVTTARTDPDSLAKYPLAGSLFKITGLGARGRPANVYEG